MRRRGRAADEGSHAAGLHLDDMRCSQGDRCYSPPIQKPFLNRSSTAQPGSRRLSAQSR